MPDAMYGRSLRTTGRGLHACRLREKGQSKQVGSAEHEYDGGASVAPVTPNSGRRSALTCTKMRVDRSRGVVKGVCPVEDNGGDDGQMLTLPVPM